MSTLLQISDTHFGTEQPPVVAALLALAHERPVDAIVWSGDITQRARRAQFAAAGAFRDRLPAVPLLALPGNHDIPLYNVAARLLRPYAGYMKVFGEDLDPLLQLPQLLVIGVNTTRPARHKDGEVSAGQVDRVARQLRAAQPQQLRVVVTHQPSEVHHTHDVHDRLHGAEPALQAWSRSGADLVLGGHIHLPYVMDLQNRPRPTPRPMWVVQAGTAVSSRIRHGTCNSVNLVHWQPAAGPDRHCRIERCDYDADSGRFRTVSDMALALG